MSRRRIKDRHLPERVYQHHGAYFFVDRDKKWHRLSNDYPEALIALGRHLAVGSSTRTVTELWTRYTAEGMSRLSPKTQRNRKQEMKQIIDVFGPMPPTSIRPSHIWEFWEKRGQTEQARHQIRAFSALLSAGVRWGALDRNPCIGIRLPGGGPRTRYVTDEEFILVRELAPEAVGLAMDLALLTGMRQGDILRLERASISDAGLTFRARKTGKVQIIQWNEELRSVVAACQRLEPKLRRLLIATRKGNQFSSNGFQTAWQRLMARAMERGLTERFTFHDLRAKSLSDAGSLEEAAARGGHSDVRVTDRVYRRLPKSAKALSIISK